MKTEMMLFIFSFIAYSVTQIFLFSPVVDGYTYGIQRAHIVRLHYFVDGVCLATASYLLLSLVGVQAHKSWVAKLIVALYIGVGGYVLLATDAFISSHGAIGLPSLRFGSVYRGDYMVVPRLLVGFCLVAVTGIIIASYRSSRENRHQIEHLYVLFAFLTFALNCFIGLLIAVPFLVSIRGILMFAAVMLLIQRPRLFDLRAVVPATREHRTVMHFRKTFRAYANDELGYREAMFRLEQAMLQYKLKKLSRFREEQKSSLPRVAQNLGVSLSSLYDLLKRLDIDRKG